MDVTARMTECELVELYNQFDTDHSGSITKENIIAAMAKVGHDITQEDLDHIMAQHDLAGDGVLSYMEFKALLLDINSSQTEQADNQ